LRTFPLFVSSDHDALMSDSFGCCAQRIIVKFPTSENMKPAKILRRLRAQFADEMLSIVQVYDWNKSFKKAGHSLKNAKTMPSAGKVMASVFWDSEGVLFIDFLIEEQIINAAYYSKLLKDRVKPAFRSKRRGQSVKSVCLLRDNACLHTVGVTSGTLEKMHWEVLPHPNLASSDFHLWVSSKETLARKRFRTGDEVKICAKMAGRATIKFFERGVMKLPERRL
jgi:hypothetical protein